MSRHWLFLKSDLRKTTEENMYSGKQVCVHCGTIIHSETHNLHEFESHYNTDSMGFQKYLKFPTHESCTKKFLNNLLDDPEAHI